jgi:hypothetical protein
MDFLLLFFFEVSEHVTPLPYGPSGSGEWLSLILLLISP